jgi:ornithine--oxo-acid transaminase
MSYLANNYQSYPISIESGIGSYIYDSNGVEYIDMFAGFGSVSLGHRHPRILKALCSQASWLAVNSRIFRNSTLEALAEQLCNLTGLPKFLPMNTGAEAVETAIKAARRWGRLNKTWYKPIIMVAKDNFHGRTTTIIGFSTDLKRQAGFGPFDEGFRIVPFNDILTVTGYIKSNEVVAIMIEPVQGEAGVIIPDDDYLKQLRALCSTYNVLLIFDEIQSGMGRTGKWWACDHENVSPDIMIIGKALGGGMLPISGILATDEVMDVFEPGSHGSTFGGNPLASAVALETLRVYENEGIIEQARFRGAYLAERLQYFNQIPIVKETRCRGLWAGIQLHKQPSEYYFCEKLLEKGVATITAQNDTIRLSPALNIKFPILEEALAKIEKVLKAE